MQEPLLDESLLLTRYAQDEIVRRAAVLECECPRYLVQLLNQIREFQDYESSCEIKNPKDAGIHEWLYASAKNLDQMLSATIIQLARMEGMIDEDNRVTDHPKLK